MKLRNILLIGAAATLCACEPLDDSNWVGNSLPSLNWKPVTGQEARPEGISTMTIRYIPQNSGNSLYVYDMPANTGAFDVQTGCYDVIALSGKYPVSGMDQYRTAAMSIPFETSSDGEKLVKVNPEMVYVATAPNTPLDYLHRSELKLDMKKALKRVNFVVNIGDCKELGESCCLELAGMAGELNLAELVPQGTGEVIHVFDLMREGRHWNEEGKLTTYKGFIHCLGVHGKNILTFTFNDAEGRQRNIRTDITAFLAEWNTDEVTLRFTINVKGADTVLKIEGFELGNTTDFEF